MELDDIKQQLEQLDGKLDAALRLNRRAVDQRILDKVDKALTRLGWALGIELALGVSQCCSRDRSSPITCVNRASWCRASRCTFS